MTDKAQKISVVLPVCHVNRDWLRASIESVLAQDRVDRELIVVNDGETEDIDALVKYYGIRKYIKNDRNRNLPYSLNRGFEAAEGVLNTWTSADNVMLPGMLSVLAGELNEHASVDVVFGRSVTMDENGAITDDSLAQQRRLSALAGMDAAATHIPRRYVYFGTLGACFMYRSEVWKQAGGYDETAHGAEDYDFWIRVAGRCTIRRLPLEVPPCYAYRVHPSSMSNTVKGCYTRMRLPILRRELRQRPTDFGLYKAWMFYSWLSLREAWRATQWPTKFRCRDRPLPREG